MTWSFLTYCSVTYFTNEVNRNIVEPTLNFYGDLTKMIVAPLEKRYFTQPQQCKAIDRHTVAKRAMLISVRGVCDRLRNQAGWTI